MMKRLLSLFLAALLLALLTGCGAGDGSNGAAPGGSAGRDNAATDSWEINGSMDFDAYPEGDGMFDAVAPAPPGEVPSAPDAAGSGRKVIYTASIDMETTDFDTASQALSRLVEDCSGYFEDRSVSHRDVYRSGRYTVRVPAAQFEAFCDQAGQICRLTDLRTTEENVSEAYYDIEARLATQRIKLERLQKLLSEADNMADIITIESAISDTELQIEYLTGDLRHYDALIDYATIQIDLREVYRLSNTPQPPQSFGERIAGALYSGLEGAVTAFEELMVLLAYIWVLILLLVLVGAGLFVLRRRKRTKEKVKEETEAKE